MKRDLYPVEIAPEIQRLRAEFAARKERYLPQEIGASRYRELSHAASEYWNKGLSFGVEFESVDLCAQCSKPSVRIYQKAGGSPLGVIFYIRGGGWVVGSHDTHDCVSRYLTHTSDCIVIAVDYRSAPENPYPAAVDDCYDAWLFALNYLENANCSPKGIGMLGDSAGANLAIAVCSRAIKHGAPLPASLALICGLFSENYDAESHLAYGDGRFGLTTEKARWFWRQYLSGGEDSPPAETTPLTADLHDFPPTYLASAQCDPLADDTRSMIFRFREAGVDTTEVQWQGATHGFILMCSRLALGQTALRHAAAFITDRIKRFANSNTRTSPSVSDEAGR